MQNQMRKSKLTRHAIKRTYERTNLDGKSANKLIKELMQFGLPPSAYTGDFYSYLHHIRTKKYNSIGVRVLHNYILLYNKRSRKAITIYPVPEKFLPLDQYIISKNNEKLNNLLLQVKQLHKNKVDIDLQILFAKPQDVVVGLSINNEFMCYGKGLSKFEAEENAIKLYIDKLYDVNKVKK